MQSAVVVNAHCFKLRKTVALSSIWYGFVVSHAFHQVISTLRGRWCLWKILRYCTVERLSFEDFFTHPFIGSMRYFTPVFALSPLVPKLGIHGLVFILTCDGDQFYCIKTNYLHFQTQDTGYSSRREHVWRNWWGKWNFSGRTVPIFIGWRGTSLFTWRILIFWAAFVLSFILQQPIPSFNRGKRKCRIFTLD